MTGKRLFIFGGGVILTALLLVAFWLRLLPAEAYYRGKPLSFWLHGFSHAANGGGASRISNPTTPYPTRAEAVAALQSCGRNGLPTLLRMLNARDSALMLKVEDWRRKHPAFWHDYETPFEQREEATRALLMTNSGAETVVPQLVAIYARRNRSQDLGVYIPAILKSIGPSATAAVPSLAYALTHDTDEEARDCAAETLAAIHAQPKIAVPALIKALRDSSTAVQGQAALALGRYGTNAEPAMPALRLLALKPEERHRFHLERWDRGTIEVATPAAAANEAMTMIIRAGN